MERVATTPPLMAPRTPSFEDRQARLRLMLVGFSISLWALIIGIRLFQLQILDRASFQRQADRQSERTINLDARRGPILDRNGRELAVSVDAESIYAVPQDIENVDHTEKALSQVVDLDQGARKELQAAVQHGRAFCWVKRKVDPQTARAVKELQLDGIGFLTENRRYYPNRELASQVLGYVGLDNTGMSGIEYSFEDAVKGTAKKVYVETDARRRPVGHTERPSTEGATVVLTLDESIQYVAETELDKAMNETRSIAGVVVVMDPRSGEILALANRPTFNPNRFSSYGSAKWKDRAVVDAYEPGSMFKVITAAAALQEKVVDPEEVIDCGGGGIEIAGVHINDHAVFYDLKFKDVIAKSSDVGTIRVAQRLGRENFDRYLKNFGFGSVTGVDLPGESSGLLRPISKWSAISLASMSFGQEVGVTALQMAAAVSAVANGGYLMKPRIVLEVQDSQGKVLKSTSPIAVRRVLNPDTVDTLTEILKGVVTDGTGRKAAIPGYVVAGKTGTAQKIDDKGRYNMIDHVASFVGFVPASRPALLVLVSLDTPKGPHNEGGDVAAPVFAKVAEHALRRLAIPPDDESRMLRAAPYRASAATPAAFTAQSAPPSTLESEPGFMPDLRGQSAREAALAAARRGLMVELKGSGKVVDQTPPPGAEIENGGKCTLLLDRTS